MSDDDRSQIEEKVTFQVDAALLFELGEQLVARPSVALAELIKNAYDADAREVNVTFSDVKTTAGSILVEDDGLGMTMEQVQQGWMRIATTNKAVNPYSVRYGRVKTGAKGVGRFATRKLARQLSLETTAQISDGQFEISKLEFNWDDFHSGMDLSSVEVKATSVRTTDPSTPGTKLKLTSLRDKWSEEEIRKIRSELVALRAPFPDTPVESFRKIVVDQTGQVVDDPGCTIILHAPEFDLVEDLNEQFLSAAWGKTVAKVGEDGKVTYTLYLRGENASDGRQWVPDQEFPSLAGSSFIVHAFLYDQSNLAGTGIGVAEARERGREHGGVKVYLDGFRVFPYGDPSDDWLGLDEQKAGRKTGPNPLLRELDDDLKEGDRWTLRIPGNNQVFGGVFITRTKHKGIRPTISRERFLETSEFQDLRKFVRLGIDWMTLEKARKSYESRPSTVQPGELGLSRPSGSRQHDRPSSSEAVTVVVESIKEDLRQLSGGGSVAQPIGEKLDRLRVFVDEQETALIDKMQMLRILASAGSSVLIFVHQIRQILGGFRGLSRMLTNDAWWLERDSIQAKLDSWTQLLSSQATQLGLLLDPEMRVRRRRLVLRPLVEAVLAPIALYCQQYGIQMEISVPDDLKLPPMYEAEVHSILLNIVTNAIKAVLDQPTRKIQISARATVGAVSIRVQDTGIGIKPEMRTDAFKPFVTTSNRNSPFGVGTGLGLAIVLDIVLAQEGTVHFIEPHEPWRTCIEVILPNGVDD